MNSRCSDPVEENKTDQGVADGVPWRNQGTENVSSDLSPIKCDRQKCHAAVASENFVDCDVVRSDPSRESEYTQELSDVTREPVVQEGPHEDVEEVAVSADTPAIGFSRIGLRVVMKGVHESTVDQVLRPDHAGGLNEPSREETSKTKTNTLGTQSDKNSKAPSPVEFVESALSLKDVGEISDTCSERGVGHDNDHSVFLEVERTWVEVPSDAEGRVFAIRHDFVPCNTHRVDDELCNVRGNGDRGRT